MSVKTAPPWGCNVCKRAVQAEFHEIRWSGKEFPHCPFCLSIVSGPEKNETRKAIRDRYKDATPAERSFYGAPPADDDPDPIPPLFPGLTAEDFVDDDGLLPAVPFPGETGP